MTSAGPRKARLSRNGRHRSARGRGTATATAGPAVAAPPAVGGVPGPTVPEPAGSTPTCSVRRSGACSVRPPDSSRSVSSVMPPLRGPDDPLAEGLFRRRFQLLLDPGDVAGVLQ